jgi:hypothetical protein
VVHKLTGATSSFGPGPYYSVVSSSQFPGTAAAVEISDRKDLNTLYKFRNLISVNRIFIKDYKVSVSI